MHIDSSSKLSASAKEGVPVRGMAMAELRLASGARDLRLVFVDQLTDDRGHRRAGTNRARLD
jgi:hypothetical protein